MIYTKNLVFGIGPGRCGSLSLATFLNSLADCNITHELVVPGRSSNISKILPWKMDDESYYSLKNNLLGRKEAYVGDVSFFLLPYVIRLLEDFPSSKFILLKRNPEEIVSSYIIKTKGRNHWEGGINKDPWDRCYPSYPDLSKEDAILEYVNEYYNEYANLKLDNKESFLEINTKELSEEKSLESILKFILFPIPSKIISIHTNKT